MGGIPTRYALQRVSVRLERGGPESELDRYKESSCGYFLLHNGRRVQWSGSSFIKCVSVVVVLAKRSMAPHHLQQIPIAPSQLPRDWL
jgi:hypothetical protein